jgi:hypothetical protein
MKVQRFLAMVVAILIISSALYGAPAQAPRGNSSNPGITTAGAVWGGHATSRTADGHHDRIMGYILNLLKNFTAIVDGAVWG